MVNVSDGVAKKALLESAVDRLLCLRILLNAEVRGLVTELQLSVTDTEVDKVVRAVAVLNNFLLKHETRIDSVRRGLPEGT